VAMLIETTSTIMRSTSRWNPYSHRFGICIHHFPERLFKLQVDNHRGEIILK